MNPTDEAVIRGVVQQWGEAWNAGDMVAAARLFRDDADFVNVRGSHWQGRAAIEAEHVRLHQLQLKGSRFAPLAIGIQPLGAAVALVHLHWGLHGDHDLDGTARPPRRGLFSWLMLRGGSGCWLIRSAHNTNITAAT